MISGDYDYPNPNDEDGDPRVNDQFCLPLPSAYLTSARDILFLCTDSLNLLTVEKSVVLSRFVPFRPFTDWGVF